MHSKHIDGAEIIGTDHVIVMGEKVVRVKQHNIFILHPHATSTHHHANNTLALLTPLKITKFWLPALSISIYHWFGYYRSNMGLAMPIKVHDNSNELSWTFMSINIPPQPNPAVQAPILEWVFYHYNPVLVGQR